MNELINNTEKMTSLVIAELTGKRHSDVLPKIEKILTELKDEDYIQRNFSLNWYIAKNGKRNKMIEMSKSGSLFIASRYDVNLHLAVQKRWEKLEVKQISLTPAEQLLQNAQLLVAQEQKLTEHDDRIKRLEAKTTTIPEYFTIAGYGTLNGISVNLKQASSLGRKASKICRDNGLMMDEIPDPRFGRVKMYPKIVLNQVFTTVIN